MSACSAVQVAAEDSYASCTSALHYNRAKFPLQLRILQH